MIIGFLKDLFSFVIGSTIDGIKFVLTKPYILIAAATVFMFSQIISAFTNWASEKLVIDLILYEEVILKNPSIFISNYSIELLTIIISGFVSLILSIMIMIAISRKINKESFIESINYSVKKINLAIGLATIYLTALIIIVGLMYFFILLIPNETIGLIALIMIFVIFVLLVFFILKFIYVIPALAFEENIRKAFEKSWNFSQKKLLKTILLLLMITIIAVFIEWITIVISNEILLEYDLVSIIARAINFSLTISIISFAYFKNLKENNTLSDVSKNKINAEKTISRREFALRRRKS